MIKRKPEIHKFYGDRQTLQEKQSYKTNKDDPCTRPLRLREEATIYYHVSMVTTGSAP